MTCHSQEERLNAFVDGELKGSEKNEFALHLKNCGNCRKEIAILSALKKSVGASLSCPETPTNLSAKIIAALEMRRPKEKNRPMRPALAHPFSWGMGLVFAMAMLMIATGIFKKNHPDNSVSLDWILAAHNEYAMSLPLSQGELALPRAERTRGFGG